VENKSTGIKTTPGALEKDVDDVKKKEKKLLPENCKTGEEYEGGGKGSNQITTNSGKLPARKRLTGITTNEKARRCQGNIKTLKPPLGK